jgi:hypothetical protein
MYSMSTYTEGRCDADGVVCAHRRWRHQAAAGPRQKTGGDRESPAHADALWTRSARGGRGAFAPAWGRTGRTRAMRGGDCHQSTDAARAALRIGRSGRRRPVLLECRAGGLPECVGRMVRL